MIASGLAAGLAVCLFSFQVALDRHFIRSGKMPKGALGIALLSAAVFLSALVHLWLRGAPPAGFAIGAATLMMASFSLFHITRRRSPPKCLPVAFENAPPKRLVVEGPHRYVRHPFYVSYMLYWAAAFLSAPSLLVGVGSMSIILIYVAAAAREERKLLNSSLGVAYKEYQERTGRFLPRPSAVLRGE